MVQVMTEVQQGEGKRTLESKMTSTILVITVPVLLLAIIGLFSGSFGIGLPELILLWVIWMVGLLWVWWPRRG